MGNTPFSHNVDPLGDISSLSLHTSIIEVLGLEIEEKSQKKPGVAQEAIADVYNFLIGKTSTTELCLWEKPKGHMDGQVIRTTFRDLNLKLRLITSYSPLATAVLCI